MYVTRLQTTIYLQRLLYNPMELVMTTLRQLRHRGKISLVRRKLHSTRNLCDLVAMMSAILKKEIAFNIPLWQPRGPIFQAKMHFFQVNPLYNIHAFSSLSSLALLIKSV